MEKKKGNGNWCIRLKPGEERTTRGGVTVKNIGEFAARIIINESKNTEEVSTTQETTYDNHE
jgi:hypothetical protein